VKYPEQKVTCLKCDGTKQVAYITKGPELFQKFIRKPLPMTYTKAHKYLSTYKGQGVLTTIVRSMVPNLRAVECPWCKGTGFVYTLRQLSLEEAEDERENQNG
jgi:hypothetical protein